MQVMNDMFMWPVHGFYSVRITYNGYLDNNLTQQIQMQDQIRWVAFPIRLLSFTADWLHVVLFMWIYLSSISSNSFLSEVGGSCISSDHYNTETEFENITN